MCVGYLSCVVNISLKTLLNSTYCLSQNVLDDDDQYVSSKSINSKQTTLELGTTKSRNGIELSWTELKMRFVERIPSCGFVCFSGFMIQHIKMADIAEQTYEYFAYKYVVYIWLRNVTLLFWILRFLFLFCFPLWTVGSVNT